MYKQAKTFGEVGDIHNQSERLRAALAKLDALREPHGPGSDTISGRDAARILLMAATEAFMETANVASDAVKLLGMAQIMMDEPPAEPDQFMKRILPFMLPYNREAKALGERIGVKVGTEAGFGDGAETEH